MASIPLVPVKLTSGYFGFSGSEDTGGWEDGAELGGTSDEDGSELVSSELTGTDDTGTSDEDGMDEPAGSAVHPVNASIATINNRANAFLLADFFMVITLSVQVFGMSPLHNEQREIFCRM
jgi:hypothetical protein